MESTAVIVVTAKENGSSQSPEKGDQVEETERSVNDDEIAGISVDQLGPISQHLEDETLSKFQAKIDEPSGLDEIAGISVDQLGPISQHLEDDTFSKFQAKIDEPAGLDEFVSNEVIAESIVVASVNGDQVTLVHDEISSISGVISTEMEICAAANLENPGIDALDDFEEPREPLDDTMANSESHTKEKLESGNADASEEATEEAVECASKHSEQSDAEMEMAGQAAKKNQKLDEAPLHGDESGGKELSKGGRFAIRADLNINSRPRRSVPRRSVFELLQGEVRPAGHSRRQLADTGSESDPEPGPSKRAPRRSRGSTNERSDVADKSSRKREEKSQEVRPTKRRNKERDEEMMDSCKSHRKKSNQSSCGVESSSEAQADVFVADDFDLVETVVGVDGLGDLEDDEDNNMTLARLRKEIRRNSSNREPSDDQYDSAGDVGVDTESNLEDLEYNSRWHSYATLRKRDSPPNVQGTNQSTKHRGGYRHARVLAAASSKKSYSTKEYVQKHLDIMKCETPVNKDHEKSGTPWYLTGSTSSETFLNDPKALQNRIDELLKVNTDLRTRLKEVEGKSSIKKFNIDFQSRKFSKVREPVFGSAADRRSAISSGRVGAGASSERGSGAGGSGKDLKHKEVVLSRREAKLRSLDVELDERTVQLKANEGKLLRTERRLKEIEKTLEYRERVLKRLETNGDRKESEKTGGDVDVPGSPEPLPGAASGSAVETDATKLERKEQELERLRRFLSEEREKLLPKQQRLTKWDAALKKKEEEIRLREHRLLSAGVARKRHISGSDDDDDSDSDDFESPALKPLNSKSTISVHKRILNMDKRKMMSSLKVYKGASQASSGIKKFKTTASNAVRPAANDLAGKKRSEDGTPLKEYKLRKRC